MTDTIPDFVNDCIDLAQPRLGAEIVSCTDDFFAECSRMLQAQDAVFIDGKFDDNGKWMDGWETRRRRNGGYDHAIVKLGLPGIIKGVDIDTTHFTGNFPPAGSLEACYSKGEPDGSVEWVSVIPSVSLSADSHHYFEIDEAQAFTHIRLNLFPDGGVARLRIYGQVQCDWEDRNKNETYDFAAVENGARAIAWNDSHYGTPNNLLAPGRGVNMGDGWETRRRREPGYDWCIIELGHACAIKDIIIDTAHFKGNYPDRCSIQGALVEGGTTDSIITQSQFWTDLLPSSKLEMDNVHEFSETVESIEPINHVRISIFPDGGLSRVRLFGKLA